MDGLCARQIPKVFQDLYYHLSLHIRPGTVSGITPWLAVCLKEKFVPVGIRTQDLRLRRATLYPAALRTHECPLYPVSSGLPDHFFQGVKIVNGDALGFDVNPVARTESIQDLSNSNS